MHQVTTCSTPHNIPRSVWKNAKHRIGITIEKEIVYGSEARCLPSYCKTIYTPNITSYQMSNNEQPASSFSQIQTGLAPARSYPTPSSLGTMRTPYEGAQTFGSSNSPHTEALGSAMAAYHHSSSGAQRSTTHKNTHRWRIYVRPARDGEDISHFIKQVVFIMHPGFVKPYYILSSPPYQVEADGWEEFEVVIIISFVDPNEKPVKLFHMLKLFNPDGSYPKEGGAVISERSSQITFTNPSEPIYRVLLTKKKQREKATYQNQNEERVLETILRASDKVRSQIDLLAREYEQASRRSVEIRKEIQRLLSKERTTDTGEIFQTKTTIDVPRGTSKDVEGQMPQ
ncbi:YEATS domain-containing protein 4-like [Schistocerca gregaria]|uniref:YEATS domain-containing protein 4-like n=1 Tax=Schistocerca gregaria TaxID=7010 RepID=UPI00211DEF32|nr:YEATS domain-containing protein 4-like [Schistocerca gregaria]